ncbi:Crp/Fnr family transcriptional regulator [Flagellimonas sp. S3867]|uniref:Crp/Fnr family transcriptional regulator n=1 Tax=Flagellimonas sp. S3867 TaxID=2768063 RepID=UPI00168886C0|nr:Crp/Fnr family transcriptional regulator [Flagellimonas sp. S3867]
MEKLRSFLKKYIPQSDVEDLIGSFHKVRKLKKRTYLLKPGQDCSFLAFVKKGTFRVFFYDGEGTEVTVWFSWEGMMIGDLLAFYKQSRAIFYVQAVEDAEISIVNGKELERQYASNPEYLEFGRRYAEHVSINVMERMLSLQTKSAEERYLELLANPGYMKNIPLKYIASYLGITDTSLSRIRKNIS